MKCPTCESQKVFPSQSGNAALFFPLRLMLICLRCHCCGRKFYRRRKSWGGEEVVSQGSSRYGSSRAT